MNNKAAVRFLIVSDTHGLDLPDLETQSRLPKADVFLHCGDLTENGTLKEFQKAIDWLAGVDAELKLVIAGNHDLDLDKDFVAVHSGGELRHEKAICLWESARQQGVVYLEEGTHTFTLRNGTSFAIFASPYQPLFDSVTAFKYPQLHDRFNPMDQGQPDAIYVGTKTSIIPSGVEIVMTHGPAKSILDQLGDGRSRGCQNLMQAIARTKPLLHCFGHIHDAHGAYRIRWQENKSTAEELAIAGSHSYIAEPILDSEKTNRGYGIFPISDEPVIVPQEETLVVNASIGNERGKRVHSPWLVELQLP
ncbi:Metallo-dependent phosphatase-like protein [Rhexocercosporidium sp. MPI-PUGE-AT-0058]|nr:Metallo-dependent phosphatase-like protein [Rhexocercosporidium sp. MPI-PUGE-AT-0058]